MKLETLEPKINLIPPFQDLYLVHRKNIQNQPPTTSTKIPKQNISIGGSTKQDIHQKKPLIFYHQNFHTKNQKIFKNCTKTSFDENLRCGTWTDFEHESFLKGYQMYGNQWYQKKNKSSNI